MPADKQSDMSDQPSRAEQVAGLLRAAASRERAPQSLRVWVAQQPRPVRARGRRLGARRSPAGWAGGFAACLAAVAAALVVALGAGAGAPSLAQAAALAARGPTSPGPAALPGSPSLLATRVGRLSFPRTLNFPNWRSDGAWRSVGERRDRVGDRTVTTVYYAASGRRVAYSIVSAPVLPGSATAAGAHTAMWLDHRAVVIWDEHGHTCLLSGAGISAAELWALASTYRGR